MVNEQNEVENREYKIIYLIKHLDNLDQKENQDQNLKSVIIKRK